MAETGAAQDRVLRLGPAPGSAIEWLSDLTAHRHVLLMLAKKDFQTRYKRASLGILWAVALPAVQAGVMAVIFTRVVKFDTEVSFAAFVMSGVLTWVYFASTITLATTSVVSGASLADKVWFPRALLVLVPILANGVGFVISMLLLVALLPVFGVSLSATTLLLVPAMALTVAMATGFGLVLSAAEVYFRDVKFLVQAAVTVWIYATPIIYPASALGDAAWLLDLNPMTGPIEIAHLAATGEWTGTGRGLVVSLVSAVALILVGVELHRRRDRLFVDQM